MRLAPWAVAAIAADGFGWMFGCVIDRGNRRVVAAEFGRNIIHQRTEIGFGEQAAADARLIGGDDDQVTVRNEIPRQIENAVDETAALDLPKETDFLVDDAVTVENQSGRAAGLVDHGASATLSISRVRPSHAAAKTRPGRDGRSGSSVSASRTAR